MIAICGVRLVCVSCAWFFASAVDVKARVEAPVADDPLEVHQPLGERGPGIAGCFAPAIRPYNVRIQSLKTSDGSVYSRQLVTTADLPCFTNSITKNLPAANNIAACAEATAKEGLNSFLWESGTCKAFLAWRPLIRADCRAGGSKVVFVAKKPITPFAGELVVSGDIRYVPPQAFLDISSRYTCGVSVPVSKGYKLQWNGTQVERLGKGTITFTLEGKHLCAISKIISVWSVGEEGEVNSKEVQLTINSGSSKWYGLQTGGCVYSSTPTGGTNATEICNTLGLSVFYEKVDGEAEAFLKAIGKLKNFEISAFIVGLSRHSSTSQWEWVEGLVQPDVDPSVWGSSQPQGNLLCARAHFDGEESIWALKVDVCYAGGRLVCYVSNP